MYKNLEEYSLDDLEAFVESEEFGQLDELSGAALGAYIQKARVDKGARIMKDHELQKMPKVVELQKKINDWYNSREFDKHGNNKHRTKIDKAHDKIAGIKKKADPNYPNSVNTWKRNRGIDLALTKLAKGKLSEDNELDESQLTLAPNDAKYKATKFPAARKVSGTYGSTYSGEDEPTNTVPTEKRGRGRPRKNKLTGSEVSVNPILQTMFGSGSTRKESVEAIKATMLESIKTSNFKVIEE